MENEEEKNSLEEERTILSEFQRYKENSVSKDKYEKDVSELKEKNQMLLDAIVNGKNIDTEEKNNVSLEEKVLELSKFKGTNLEYWTKMTSAIDTLLETTPKKEITKVTGSDGLEELIKVNEGMKKMVKDSNNNPDTFMTLFNNEVEDGAPRITAQIDAAGGFYNYLVQKKAKK